MFRTSAQLKEISKQQLQGRLSDPIVFFLVYYAISMAFNFVINIFLPDTSLPVSVIHDVTTYAASISPIAVTVSSLISIIASLITAVLTAGVTYGILKFTRIGTVEVSDLFYCFKNSAAKIILSSILIGLISLIFFIPFLITAIVLIVCVTISDTAAVIGTIFFVLGFVFYIVMAVIVSLQYALTTYIILDNPQVGVMESLKKSKQLMKGQKGRLFYIQVSFIGWILLSFLTCCIGFLVLNPYMYCTYSNFYRELIGENLTVNNPQYSGYTGYPYDTNNTTNPYDNNNNTYNGSNNSNPYNQNPYNNGANNGNPYNQNPYNNGASNGNPYNQNPYNNGANSDTADNAGTDNNTDSNTPEQDDNNNSQI